MSKKNLIAAAVASFGLSAFGAAAVQADTLIAPSSTTYEYTTNANINFQNGGTLQAANELTLAPASDYPGVGYSGASGYGSGVLNDGLIGNQTYLDTMSNGYNISNSSKGGPFQGSEAYQDEGGPSDSTSLGGSNAPGQAFNQGIYYGNAFTVQFNLGQNYTNLSTVTVYIAESHTINNSESSGVSITGSGSGATTVTQAFSDVNSDPNGPGEYFADTINISSLSGQYITLDFNGPNNQWAGFNEIDFATSSVAMPEPASLSLLGIGALGLMRRRARRVR